MNLTFNKYQTPLTEELLNSLDKYVRDELLDTLDKIELVKNIVSPTRKFAKDLPKDTHGKVIVDITNPHILEDMNYFRQPVIHFEQHGCYSFAHPSRHPKSEFQTYWKEQERRCKEGYVRESDGEWITGYNYFYWNFSPILKAVVKGDADENNEEVKKVKEIEESYSVADRIEGFPDPWDGDYLYYHYVDQANKNGKYGSVVKTRGRGYEQPYSAIIKTPYGETTMGDIKPGDKVLTPTTNLYATVLEKYEQGVKDVYEIEFSDGRKVECGLNHLWAVYEGYGKKKQPYKVVSLEYILNKGLYKTTNQNQKAYKFKLPKIHVVEYPEQKELPIHPYVLGALLGDGSMSTGSIKIATSDSEIVKSFENILGDQYELMYDDSTTNNYRIVYKAARKDFVKVNPLKNAIIDLNLNVSCKHKFIPEIYKRSSIYNRMALVKGLMDTDGSINEKGFIEFTNTCEQLVDDLADVLRSLGIQCKKSLSVRTGSSFVDGREIVRNNYFRLYIKTNYNVFSLSRKSKRVRKKNIFDLVFIRNVKKVRQEQSACILIDSEEHVYLTNGFIPTHNSFKGGAFLNVPYHFYPKSKAWAFASEKGDLTEDGLLSKAWDTMSFVSEFTPWRKSRHEKDTMMHKKASYKDLSTGNFRGYKSEIIGLTTKNNPEKAHPYSQIVYTPQGITTWEHIVEGSKLFTIDGKTTIVKEVHEFGTSNVYRMYLNNGQYIDSSKDHEWEVFYYHQKDLKSHKLDTKTIKYRLDNFKYHKSNCIKIKVNKEGVKFNKKEIPLDAYTLGLMLGDGSINKTSNNQMPLTMLKTDFDNIKHLIPYETKTYTWGAAKNDLLRNILFVPNGRDILKELKLFDKVAHSKFIPDVYKYNTKQIRLDVINGLLDTDGSVTKDFGVIEYSTKSEQLANDFLEVVRSLGVNAKKTYKTVNNTKYYRCYIYCDKNETRFFNLPRKKELIKNKKLNSYALNKVNYLHIVKIEKLETQERIKCVTVDHPSTMYLIDNNVKTFNSRGKRGQIILYEEAGRYPDLLTAWNIARPSMEQGRAVFGLMVAYGTGGTFTTASYGLEKLFYEGAGYRVYTTKNVYDKIKTNNSCAFYSPEYLNRHGCYDKNGNSDVIKALIEIFQGRLEVIRNTSDPMAITQEKADRSITPQEAFAKISGSVFPVDDLKDYLSEIIPNQEQFTSAHSIGRLKVTAEGIEFVNDRSKYPIYDYPLSEKSDKQGAVQIYAHPVKINGQVTKYRYISGLDPIDDDYSTTNSLPSIFIFDTFTDNIVAEYTGRPNSANEFYEIALRLLEYYNAICNYECDKKGLFAYFSNKNKLYLLADNPKILKDMDMTATKENFGNKAKGVNSSKRINQWGRRLQADWLTTTYTLNDDKQVLNLQRLQSIAYIKELIAWNEDINADRVSAMGMCMILREEYRKYSDSAKEDNMDNSLEMDPYFIKNLPNYKLQQLKYLKR